MVGLGVCLAIHTNDAQTADLRIRHHLDEDTLVVVAQIAVAPPEAPLRSHEVARKVLDEFVEMRVLRETDGVVTLNTAVFLRDDIERIVETVTPLGAELARLVCEHGLEFQDAPP